jgi:putative transposase
MPNYHRMRLPGATIFITCVTFNRAPILTDPIARQILCQVVKIKGKRRSFTANAFCLLPDHFHILMTLPENDVNYSLRIREIKRLFTRYYLVAIGKSTPQAHLHIEIQRMAIWQSRFWEHTIRDEQDFKNHFDYVHYNPVKHGLVTDVRKWEWSSFHRYVKLGVDTLDWGSGMDFFEEENGFGE